MESEAGGGEGVDLHRVLEGGALAGVGQTHPHLQTHLEGEGGEEGEEGHRFQH